MFISRIKILDVNSAEKLPTKLKNPAIFWIQNERGEILPGHFTLCNHSTAKMLQNISQAHKEVSPPEIKGQESGL